MIHKPEKFFTKHIMSQGIQIMKKYPNDDIEYKVAIMRQYDGLNKAVIKDIKREVEWIVEVLNKALSD